MNRSENVLSESVMSRVAVLVELMLLYHSKQRIQPMDQDILRIEDVEVLRRLNLSDHTGQIELRISAIIADMVQTVPAVLYPPDIAEPAQYGQAHCVADVTVYLDDVQWEIAE